jgi:phenylpyruvate tautomerase PptA (4-oxalocrotonate tautomerase family)
VPVIHVEALRQQPEVDVDAVLATVCCEVADLLGEEPNGTWGTWRTLERYVEGADERTTQPRDTHPPFARVVAFEGKDPETVTKIVRCVAEALVRELGLAEGNAFVTYEEARRGRLYSGGEVIA